MIVAQKNNKSIEIDNVGPISHLSIPVPEGGGVVVLHGASGVGKTHALTSVTSLTDATARKKLQPSDRMPSGRIKGLGVTIRLGRSNTSRGELECQSLDSGVDPSLLVDPGIKDPIAADSKRLATLVKLSGIKIDSAKWGESVGKHAEEISLVDLVSDDPVQTADKIRRRLHDIALKTERIAESKGAEGAALLKSIADVDTTVEIDAAGKMDAVNEKRADLLARKKQYEASKEAIGKAKTELASAESLVLDVDGLRLEIEKHDRSLNVATGKRIDILVEIDNLRSSIEKLEDKAAEQLTAAEIAKSKKESAEQRLSDAEWHLAQVKQLRESVNATLPEAVTDEELAAVELERKNVMELIASMEVVRRARTTKYRADILVEESNELASSAEEMRKIARSTDSVLEQALIDAGFDQIKVHDGRLCVESDRGLEPVSELSTGERWRLALDLAAQGLPTGAILTVQQEGWQALDDELKADVATMAKERGLLMFAAQVDGGALRAEVYGDE